MTMLFQWKHAKFPGREVVLLSGGAGFGTTGDVRDEVMGLSLPVVMIGPTLGRVCAPTGWQLRGEIDGGDRFTYAHRKPLKHWNFCTVEVDLSGLLGKPAVSVSLVSVPIPAGTTWTDGPTAD